MARDVAGLPVKAAVVVPVGPSVPPGFVDDTLASVDRFGVPTTLVVVNDSARSRWPASAVVVPAPTGAPGGQGGLFVKLAAGIRRALEDHWDVLLRLDTDALVLRGGLVSSAAARFAADPTVGLLGAVRVGPDGGARSFGPAASLLRSEAGWRGLRRPAVRRAVRALPRDGAHGLGGAYVLSRRCAMALEAAGWLTCAALARSRAGEDHLMGAAVRACGFTLGEFSRPGDPLAVRWVGLPASPESVWASGAAVTHSVRSWGALSEAEVRAEFRELALLDASGQRR